MVFQICILCFVGRSTENALKMYLPKIVSLFLHLIAIYGSLEFCLTEWNMWKSFAFKEEGSVESIYCQIQLTDRKSLLVSQCLAKLRQRNFTQIKKAKAVFAQLEILEHGRPNFKLNIDRFRRLKISTEMVNKTVLWDQHFFSYPSDKLSSMPLTRIEQ